jgi:transposase
MPTKGTSMRKLTQIIRLHFDSKLSTRQIANSLSLSVGVINKYIQRAVDKNITWPLPVHMDEQMLLSLLKPSSSSQFNSSKEAGRINFAKIHHELRLKTVTLQLLWDEYQEGKETHLSYSRFCHHYRIYTQSLKRSMRQTHKAGDKVFIDYSGVTFNIIDPETNDIRSAEIFVGVLGASKYTFAEATWSQQLPDFLASQRRMFEFFGGVPALIIPDNLRSAISKSCRYEPDINPTYAQFIEHYGTAVLPARPYRPKDKPSVESGVQVVQRWILGRLRHQTFVGLSELNMEIKRLLKVLNQKLFQKLPGCRESAFLEVDKPELKALPSEGYQYRHYKASRAGVDYHLVLDGHYYSVPHRYCGELIDLWFNQHTVECYFKGERIAIHLYSTIPGQQSTITHHMPKRHRKQSEQSKERFIRWAEQIGVYTHVVVKKILEEKPHLEQAYRSCLGLLSLSKKYGEKRLEQACSYGVHQGAYSRKSILSILKNNLDQLANISSELLNISTPTPDHVNIRGSHYYH